MSFSLYHSATGKQAPHCIHAIGVGKAGTDMIDALIRTGEVEDMLEDQRARFTALAVDIGDQDSHGLKDYAHGFAGRLEGRGIPTGRAQIRTVGLEVPSKDTLLESLGNYPKYLDKEYPRYFGSPNGDGPWLPSDIEVPEAGDHFPRAIAKAIYGREYYEGGPVAEELEAFAKSVRETELPSMVLVCFGLGGGTGSGIAVDLARHLTNVELGRTMPVFGVGVMPFTGDPEAHRGGDLFATLNEIDCMVDEEKNESLVSVWGDMYKNPFTGGFIALPQEQAWQRLSRYTNAGDPQLRHGLQTKVTRKFINDSFVRFIVDDYGRTLFKVMRPAGATGAPHESIPAKERNWAIFDVAKLTHPGVEVLPGEPLGKWREVMTKWMGYIPQWSGLREGFKTDYIEAQSVSARVLWNGTAQKKLEETLQELLLPGDDSTLNTSHIEFFDELTAYVNIIISGVAKTDLTAFWEAREKYDAMEQEEKLLAHSWLLELGLTLSEPSVQLDALVPHEVLRGDALGSSSRAERTSAFIAPMVETVVETP